ncbi:MAG: molybdopterin biosynthesis protein, partial [Desulfurococcales archaeon]|nr:molybdopterin biosynthesis protein [Desulfurococcales archaeon]
MGAVKLVRKLFHRLVKPVEVLDVLKKYVELRPTGTEVVTLADALGRVLAEGVYASWDAPPFDRSEVDGYATVARSLEGAEEDNPVALRVTGHVKIGETPTLEIRVGEAAEIDTGAMIPRGADSVVMVEYTKQKGNEVLVYRSVAPGENIARAGSDILRGELILREGTLLTSAEIAALAAVGVDKVKVFKSPRVGIISIGDELVEPGAELKGSQIFDVNTYSLAAAVKELGGTPKIYGIVKDEESSIRNALLKALSESDIVLTSGGTSAGVGDLTYRVLDSLGSPGVVIHGLKQKP